MSSDALLDALQGIGDGVVLSVGLPITVLTAGARIEGAIAREVDFAERFDRDIAEGMRQSADNFEDIQERAAAEELAKVFEAAPTYGKASERVERRQELSTQLDELAQDDPGRKDLEEKVKRLGPRPDVLVLRDPEIWTYGYNPLQGPLRPPFVRIAVSSITAWWLGHIE